VNREVRSVVLMLFGVTVLRLCWEGAYTRYVKPTMLVPLVLSGVLLVALGLLALARIVREGRGTDADPHDHEAHDADDAQSDGHAHGSLRAAWLLLLPVATIFLVAPPALGAYTASREQSTVLPSDTELFSPLPAGSVSELTLNDFATRAVWDGGKTLTGRSVRMTGFVTAAPDGGWYLTRLMLTCCAADALATKILMVDPSQTPAVDSWVTVTGKWTPGGNLNTDDAIPWFTADSITAVAAPDNPYE